MPHSHVLLPLFHKLPTTILDSCRTSFAHCSRSWSPCKSYDIYHLISSINNGSQRSPKRLFISSIEKETRRKIWWGVYTLDRMLALALGRPLGVEDTDCDVEYPVDVDDEELPEYYSGAPTTRSYP